MCIKVKKNRLKNNYLYKINKIGCFLIIELLIFDNKLNIYLKKIICF